MKQRLGARAAISAAAVLGLVFVGADPASALGGNNYDCGVSGNYNVLSVSGGASTHEISGNCGTVSVRVYYQAYPGSPKYWSTWTYHASLANKNQSYTLNGQHSNTNDGKIRNT